MKTNIEKLQYYFRHFSLRLAERYNILISFEEYVDICSRTYLKEAKYVSEENKNSICGFLNIKGIDVKVIKRNNKPKALLTALPIKTTKK